MDLPGEDNETIMIDDAVTWVPPVDIYEIDNDYVLNAELPGVDRRDIKMEFSESGFTLRGECRLDAICAKESYHRLEGHRGKFHREFSLPEPIDKNRVQIELKDGVLRAVLPKARSVKNPSPQGNR